MAKARALERRRRSIRSIRKITRTMELIARAKFKKAMDRAAAAGAYTRRITELVTHLAHSGLTVSHPLLESRPVVRSANLLVLSANRGLCGGYNSSVLRQAYGQLDALRAEGIQVHTEVSGKRGIGAFRFRRIPTDASYTHFDDRPTFEEVDVLATRYIEEYLTGRIDQLDVVYTRFESAGRQYATVETLLPLGRLDGAGEETNHLAGAVEYEFLPSAESILDEIVPASFKVRLFKCFLDAAASEQIARMVAMKAATENAEGMIGSLSMAYNRARQGQITGDLLEIIGGAEALNQ
jgi:F-type H+-transporting ATPase subunit gamma